MDIKEADKETHALGAGKRHPWEAARFEVVTALAKPYLSRKDSDITVLDLGCGDLFFADQLQKRVKNVKIVAVDTAFDQETIHTINSYYQNSNIQAFRTLEESSAILKKVDVVFLLDVIEHIADDAAFLTSLRQQPFITEDTVIIITTPAFPALFSSHDVFLDHYRRYTDASLNSVLNNAGYKSLDKGYFFFSLLPLRISQVLLEKLRPAPIRRKGTDVSGWKGNALTTKLFQQLLLFDYKITSLLKKTGLNVAGLSTYAICTRSAS